MKQIRISKELYKRINKIAKGNNRTANGQAVVMLEEILNTLDNETQSKD